MMRSAMEKKNWVYEQELPEVRLAFARFTAFLEIKAKKTPWPQTDAAEACREAIEWWDLHGAGYIKDWGYGTNRAESDRREILTPAPHTTKHTDP
ncbi:MAG: hypothetical protein ACI9R3_003768 [Verrucomicrobiales bacterium]